MKILAIMNAHALAHVSRLLEVAKVLRSRGHELTFAGHGKYLQAAAWDGFAAHELPYISVDRVVEAVRTQRLWTLYREEELETFIAAELALYETAQPGLVLLDNRPSARTSADIAGIRTAAVLNVHMSNYRQTPFFSYRQLTRNFPGTRLADRVENAFERQLYDRLVMGGLNAIRVKRGLRPYYAYEHEEGDLSLLADIPEFNPVNGALPAHVQYIGPLTWRNTLPPPECLAQLDHDKPTVYITLGSESLGELLSELGALARQGMQIIVATGAVDVHAQSVSAGVFVERYVNTELVLPYCDLVCCHGGNGTLYQALSHGLPCIVVATHAEQHYGGKRIQELGLGLSVTLKRLRRTGIAPLVDAVRQVIGGSEFRRRAQAFALHLKECRGAERAADAIAQHFAAQDS